MPAPHSPILIAVDIGNSRIKLGRFDGETNPANHSALPQPSDTIELPIDFRNGQFDEKRLSQWASKNAPGNCLWSMASVHHAAAGQFTSTISYVTTQRAANWQIRRLTFTDVDMPIHVTEPSRVGIDRLLAAFAADRLRRPDRVAVVVDLGSAITVDLVDKKGGFAGGAILPGIAMSARALSEQTDALPHVTFESFDHKPTPIGKSTVAAIESGLVWGTVGAIRELIRNYSLGEESSPDVFLTGGASPRIAELLAAESASEVSREPGHIQHVESMVLSGIALVHGSMRQ